MNESRSAIRFTRVKQWSAGRSRGKESRYRQVGLYLQIAAFNWRKQANSLIQLTFGKASAADSVGFGAISETGIPWAFASVHLDAVPPMGCCGKTLMLASVE
jgi:hypothetical protein